MTWWVALVRRSVTVLLLAFVGVLTTAVFAAASVAPDWTADAAPPGLVAASGPTAAASDGMPRDRWSWPLQPRPPVVSRFDPPAVRWGSGHRGVDLGASAGQAVLAPTGGAVAFRGTVVDRGVLVLETSAGLRITFEPVDSALAVGASVEQGQLVGIVSTVPGHCAPVRCLHWGVLDGATYLDPLAFVGAVRVVLLPLRPP
ncbi:MAG TPA: peptidoglycan DD-metalloendopeptidase family protein [Lapillicoccus sp.]